MNRGPTAAAVAGLCAVRLIKSARRLSKRHYTYGGGGGQPAITMLYRWPQLIAESFAWDRPFTKIWAGPSASRSPFLSEKAPR